MERGLSVRSDGFVRVSEVLGVNVKTMANRLLSSHSVEDVRQVKCR